MMKQERNSSGESPKIETVRTASCAMNYFRFGKGEKTLVILPGLSVQSVMRSASAVAEAYRLLAKHYTIYLFDRRSELPEAYSAREMARDTYDALRALGIEKACVFGVSQGGMIALQLAIDYPELVEKLLLGSVAARMTAARRAVVDEWVRPAKRGDAEALYLAFGKALYPETVFAQSRELLLNAARTVTREELDRFLRRAEATRDFDVTDALERIACPVLVLGSKDDRVLGAEAAEEIAARLRERPDFAIYLYDGYGHAAYDLAPDYQERLLRFLSGIQIGHL